MAVSISQLLEEHIWVRPHEAVSLARRLWDVLPGDDRLMALLESIDRPIDILRWLELDATGRLKLTAPGVDRVQAAPVSSRSRWESQPTNIVRLLGRTLDLLLPLPDAPPSYRVPERLRAHVRRALQATIPADVASGTDDDIRPFRSVEEFLGVLRPFETGDGQSALADLYARWEACHQLSLAGATVRASAADDESRLARFAPTAAAADRDRTVFDSIRRVRETVGVSVNEIGKRSKIPLELLEQFERGELTNWPKGLFGRQYVREYAREAGLDPDALLQLIAPKLTPDESLDFIRATWKSAAEEGRPPTFHDPANEGGRYYPDPVLDEGESQATPTPKALSTPTPGLLLGSATTTTATADLDDEPSPTGGGRIATVGFLILIALAFAALLIFEP